MDNWAKEMKYLIPAMGIYLIAMISKNSVYMQGHFSSLESVVLHLLSSEIRMEPVGIQVASVMFEKFGLYSGPFLHKLLVAIFTSLHFYRNNTKQKFIPVPIIRAVHTFFATFMVNHGSAALLQACNQIQPGILNMILTSEGEAVKHVGGQPRDKKYAVVAYSKYMIENIGDVPQQVL
mmetsp:Transcript_42464/g.31105  ORF Transcript_42464/g.31105 Transcript_42464/m.31105 type:complete len:178 (+) Transcript_42464:1573-2106(+)